MADLVRLLMLAAGFSVALAALAVGAWWIDDAWWGTGPDHGSDDRG